MMFEYTGCQMNDVKHSRFCKVVENRMEVLINDFYKLGNCASKASYDYTDAEVAQIFGELERQINLLKDRFNGKKAFSLSETDRTSIG